MGIRNLVVKQVELAFKMAGDLLVEATLSQTRANNFNFNTEVTTLDTAVSKVVKAIKVLKRRNSESNTLATKLVFKASDIDDTTVYDNVTIDGILWNIVPPYENNGYLVTVEIRREA